MLLKIIIGILLFVVVYCLGSGMYYMVTDEAEHPEKMAKALTWRVALSLGIFILIMISYYMGWIVPHDVLMAQPGS